MTDYTRNEQMAGVQSNWCPTSLSDFVLQMEMWDDAAEVARTMREGEYYLIKNARMRANINGYLEGKVAQSKIVQLEEANAKTNIHLQSLLESVDHFHSSPPTDDCFSLSFLFINLTIALQEEEGLDCQTTGQTRYRN